MPCKQQTKKVNETVATCYEMQVFKSQISPCKQQTEKVNETVFYTYNISCKYLSVTDNPLQTTNRESKWDNIRY